MFLLIGWLWALVVNYDRPWVLLSFSTLLLVMGLLTSARIPIKGKTRLAGLAGIIVLIAETAFLNNRDVVIGTLMVMPAAVVITNAFGGRTGAFWLSAINGAMLYQAYVFDFHPLAYILRMVPLTMVWSVLIATWTMMLVRQIDGFAKNIEQLRHKERKLYSTLNHELAEPIGILARMDPTKPMDTDEVERFRTATESLRHNVDSLGPIFEVAPKRPAALDTFCPSTLLSQLRVQHAPSVERWSKNLVVDASQSAKSLVVGDLFRLRIILSNVLRTAAMLSDGSTLWMNVRGEQQGQDGLLITFEVESNGHPLAIDSLRDMLDENLDADEGWAFSMAGLRLAQLWCREMGGELELFQSPRGGNGFRVSNSYPVLSRTGDVTSDTAQAF